MATTLCVTSSHYARSASFVMLIDRPWMQLVARSTPKRLPLTFPVYTESCRRTALTLLMIGRRAQKHHTAMSQIYMKIQPMALQPCRDILWTILNVDRISTTAKAKRRSIRSM